MSANHEYWIAVCQFGVLVVVARIFPDVHEGIGPQEALRRSRVTPVTKWRYESGQVAVGLMQGATVIAVPGIRDGLPRVLRDVMG